MENWFLHSRFSEVYQSHTSKNKISNLKTVFKTWDIENKVMNFVCDNAAVEAINDMNTFNLVRRISFNYL